MGKGDKRCDLLGNDIEVSSSILLVLALADTVDLVVDRGTVVVTVLTSTGNSPLDMGRMPCTDTGDLSETLVCLSWQLLGAPSGSDTGETVTLCDSDAVDHLVLLEDGVDLDWFLKKTIAELNLVSDASTVDLDLHEMSLLLLKRCRADLGVCENTNDLAVLLDALDFTCDGRTLVVGVLLGVLGESLLLRLVPVLVESSLDLVAQVLGPDGGEGSETTGCLNVADKTNDHHLVLYQHMVKYIIDSILHTGGVSTTVTASTTSFLCIFAPGRSRSRTIVVMPAL